MKGLLIIGHPHSDYQFIENTLYDQGMSKAKPSRRDKLTPTAITQDILQIYDTSLNNQTEIHQVDSGEIWNGLALDLLLGNKDQAFWGWADPQAIFLLDYWKKMGSQLKFLLVYDTPETVCCDLFQDQPINPEKLEQEVKHWEAFYKELIHFYQQNKENCLLVHIEQIRRNFSKFIQSTSELVGHMPTSPKNHRIDPMPCDETDRFLITQLLKDFPAIYESYEELQAVADIPLTSKKAIQANNAIMAWNARKGMQISYKDKISGENKTIRLLKEKNSLIEKERKNELEKIKQDLKEKDNENELLLLQLHQVQEELEVYFIKNQKIEKEIKQLSHLKQAAA